MPYVQDVVCVQRVSSQLTDFSETRAFFINSPASHLRLLLRISSEGRATLGKMQGKMTVCLVVTFPHGVLRLRQLKHFTDADDDEHVRHCIPIQCSSNA